MKDKSSFAFLWLAFGLCTASAQLFTDNFTRGTDPAALTTPWLVQSASWAVTGGALNGGPNAGVGYGFAYVATNSWTNYSVQAQIRFSATSVYGGGIGGRVDSTTGAHYAAWVYPEASPSGLSSVLKIIRFSDWANYVPIAADLQLPGVGTNAHTLKLEFQGSQISVYYDGNQLTNLTDATYTSGGISVDMWTDPANQIFFVDDVAVNLISSLPVANGDSYNSVIGTTLTVSAPGVLGNDSGGVTPLSAILVSGPTKGNFSLNANGGFTYTATNNYTGPDSFTYRASDGLTNSGIATVSISVTTNTPPVANPDSFTLPSNVASTIGSPGVLVNDTDLNGNALTAVLAAGTTNGTLSLSANGGFTYTPNNNYVGPDAFTYRANDGLTNSASVALVTISVLPVGQIFADNFSRLNDPGLLTPWQTNTGQWTVTGGMLIGGTNTPFNYGYAYMAATWTNYSVQGRIQFSNTNAWGGGIGGRLADPLTGAHYAAWVYPDASAGGSNVLVLIKFPTYTSLSFVSLAQVPLGSVGTNFHTIKLAFAGNQIGVSYDGILRTNVTDVSAPFLSGGITADMWTDGATPYSMAVDDVVVNRLAVEDYYSALEDTPLTVGAAGILTNDTGISGGLLTATLVNGPVNGTLLNFGPDGSFTYLATSNYVGTDSFTYRANDGLIDLGTATVVLTVAADNPIQRVFFENFDGVSAPALPAGWTTSATGVQSSWVTQAATSDSSPNSVFSPDPNNVGLNELVSPVIALPVGQAQLAFRNNYNLEVANAGVGYDGAVLEIKIGANAFADILAAGGSFVTGGYNRVITNAYGNALSNRPAWSGNSGGYISTLVNLPAAAAGQSIQLRWRCGTDTATAGTGWRIDTVSITNCASSGCWNTPPLFNTTSSRTIVELTTVIVTNTAIEYDIPPNAVTYSLVTSPTGATINTNTGVVTWMPTEAQGPSTTTFRVRALDNGSPPLSSTNLFVITVTETNNNAPILPAQTNRTVIETTLLTVNNGATDADLPANTLSYSLLVAPSGAAISTAGVITWTPNDSFGGTTNTFTTRVVDNVAPTLSATNTFLVIVLDTNNVPTLPAQTNRTIAELSTLTVTNTATDTDIPTNSLSYSLLVAPITATISANGVITWTPGEADGPSTNTFTTRVVDDGVPVKSATNTFSVIVTEVNVPPVFVVTPNNRTINELTLLTVTNNTTDADFPTNVLTYALLNPPGNAQISTNGVITWTPQENEGPGTNTLTTVVSDGNVSVTNSFVVTVAEVNVAPVFVATPTNQTINALTLLTVTNIANDSDLPANLLSYTLFGPVGAGVTNGVITWTPEASPSASTNIIVTVVTDNGIPPLSATNTFTVVVPASQPVVPPVIQSVSLSNDLITIIWSAVVNQGYLLQSVTNISSTNWLDVGAEVIATGPTALQTNSVLGEPQKFFRVRLAP